MGKPYKSIDEIQTDLDDYPVSYNNKHLYQRRDMNGTAPYAVFMKGLPKEKKTVAKSATKTA